MTKKRDYKKEYRDTHGTEKGKTDRAARNAARAKMEKAGRVRKGDGKEIDHKDHNPRNNGSKNLRVVDKSVNRKKQPLRGKARPPGVIVPKRS